MNVAIRDGVIIVVVAATFDDGSANAYYLRRCRSEPQSFSDSNSGGFMSILPRSPKLCIGFEV